MPSHRGQFLSTMQGLFALHGQVEQRVHAGRARKLAEQRVTDIANARPSVALGHGRIANLANVRAWGMCDSSGLFLGALDGEMLFYAGDSHLLTYARNGGGKGRDVILPNLAHVRDRSLVVVDVKDGENCYASHRHRSETIGDQCVFLNPFGLLGLPNTRINPLQLLRDVVARGAEIDTEADEIALILLPPGKSEDGENGWTRKGARRLISVRAEYTALFEPDLCSLSGLWRFVNATDEQVVDALQAMMKCGRDGIAGRAAALYAAFDTSPKQWEAYRADAIDALAPFEPGKTLERATSAHEFDLGRLKRERCTVYLIAPSEKLGVVAPWISLIVNYAIEAIAKETGPVRTTFLLDEFPQLPPAPAIMKALRLYRGKGINLWLFSQGRYSMEGRWSRDAVREFEDQAAVFQTWSVEDQTLLKDLTLWSGTQTINSFGLNYGGGIVETAGSNLGEAHRAVLQTEDIRSIGADGRQILKIAGRPYLIVAGRVPYFTVDPWKFQLFDVRELHFGGGLR